MKDLIENLKQNDKSPKYYQYYPRLFHNYYEDVDDDIVLDLSDAGYLYYQSTLCTDSVVDDKDFSKFPFISLFQEGTIKILTSIYGKESVFWNYWEKRRKEYFEAVKIEKGLNINNIVDFNIYEDLADKKSAFGKVAIDCLYVLSKNNDEDVYNSLLRSHYYFSVGFQLYDDLKDFDEDFNKEQFNWAIYELNKVIVFSDYKNNILMLNKLLYIKGVGQEILSKSITYFQKAFEILESLGNNNSQWKEVVIDMKETIEIYLEVTNGYIGTIAKKVELEKYDIVKDYFFDFASVTDNRVKKGLQFIKNDFLHHYADLNHYMYFSKNRGFEEGNKIHFSDTFQRAMLNDCIIDVSKFFNFKISKFLELESDYFISRVNQDLVGGWSYFPTVAEIAADIDDLGQIIQFFIKSNQEKLVDMHCVTPIKIALEQRVHSNGSIETWIVPTHNQTEKQKKQDYFNQSKWGTGPDLEVVANFVYALQLYDIENYKVAIEKALPYIIDNQKENGCWESRWYYGNYYGTYVSLRALKNYSGQYSKEINNALQFIIESKNKDGGYGLDDNSDSLSTSFALLSLKLFYEKSNPRILELETYLFTKQSDLGCWDEVNFIKPRQQEPYKSRVLTTAFVLKSLCI
jgi:squalene-hopene/tetraprenyl-beta-curcumene cyclase